MTPSPEEVLTIHHESAYMPGGCAKCGEPDGSLAQHQISALAEHGYAIVKRVSRADLERAYEFAYGKETDPHEAAVLLVAKRYIFGESLELKI